jgi:hypothetical protein
VDFSDPIYKRTHSGIAQSTNGSWWIVQVRPMLLAQEGLAHSNQLKIKLEMIQAMKAGLAQSTNYRWWDFRNPFELSPRRLDLKNPPTSVGGIHATHKICRTTFSTAFLTRMDTVG